MAGESAREEARRVRDKAERLARRAEMFEKGAEGESATAGILSTLQAEWTVLHDVRWPSRRLANIEHVVIGPGGIFVIDSKNWSGDVTVRNGHLRQNGRSRESAVASCADAGLAIAELAGFHAAHVNAVLCFATDKPMSGWCRDVMVCSTATLLQMLSSRLVVLGPGEVAAAAYRLDAQLTAAASSSSAVRRAGATTPGRAALGRVPSSPAERRSRARRSRRRKKELIRLIGSLMLLGGFVAYGPQIASAVGGLVAEEIPRNLTTADCDEGGGPKEGGKGAAGGC
jgi:hypothetical protein